MFPRTATLVSLMSCLFAAAPVYALDLIHAYEAALSNDPVFRAAAKEQEAGQANRVIGRAALLPKANVSYSQMYNNTNISGAAFSGGPSVGTIRNDSYASDAVTVQLVQPLFNLAALASMRQGMAKGNMSDARYVAQSQDLLVRVLQAYTDVLYAEDNLAYISAQRDAYREQLKVNQRTYDKGEGTVTDLLETKASLQMSEAQVIEAMDTQELAKRKLEALIGENLHSVKEVKKLGGNFRVVPLVPRAFELWKDQALANNPELRAADHYVEVAKQEYEKQRAAHMPTVSGIVAWNQQDSSNVYAIGQRSVNSQAGVQISVPIFTGGETTGMTTQARANLEKAKAERDQTRDKIVTEVRKQFDLVNSSMLKIEALNRAVESATELTKAMRKSVQGGQRINLDVLVADKGLATSQRDLSQAKYNYMLAEIRLKQQAGTLSLEDFEKVAKNFIPDAAPKVAKAQP